MGYFNLTEMAKSRIERGGKGIRKDGRPIVYNTEGKAITKDIGYASRVVIGYLERDALRVADGGKTEFNQTLAKLIFAENPGVFSSVDSIRTRIRYFSSKRGDTNKDVRSKAVENIFDRPTKSVEEFRSRFYFESDVVDIPDYVLEPGRWGIVSDIHYPYHDKVALEIALENLHKKGIKKLLLLGDIMDFYECSDFEKDRSKRKLAEEISGFRDEILPILQDNFERIVFKIGNHEHRWTRLLRRQAPMILGMPEFQLDVILRLGEKGIGFADNMQKIKAGKLDIWHGHEIRGGFFIPVNPARSAMVKYKGNILIGHHHRTSFEPMQLANGDSYGAWSLGCLCDLRPEYYPTAYTVWNHGFGELALEGDGNFQFENWRIIKGKVVHS